MTSTSKPVSSGKRRILVVANQTLEGRALRHVIRLSTDSEAPARVLVVAPALNSPLRHWLSDEDEARRGASLRLGAALEQLRAAGIEAEGRVGDADPLLAITDAMHEFGAEEIVITTHSEGRSRRPRRDLVARARRRFAVPILRVCVEPGNGSVLVSEPTSSARHTASAQGAAAARPQGAQT